MPETTLRQYAISDEGIRRDISDEEWEAARRIDGDIPWTELPASGLVASRVGLAFLDDQDFVYYLPAFPRFAYERIDTHMVPDEEECFSSALFAVSDFSNYNLSRLKKLSDDQTYCVVQFLNYVAHSLDRFDADIARKALNDYWMTPKAHVRSLIERP